ncbi:SIR2 family NAD-dependent protein deacylase [Thiorhodovibrio frisius]|uniref:NAD-dependent protein deacylase n=1 Tax=Thiorhodovibrio frisius TaxID=631362 RepID=H8Z7V4_9GAMM|nr:NAD-dependent deacylase [Thiorhodovibrio frisius]EIC20966.1 NAD-dependent protein deacetylase, SIR2 family [Thiorhodovibrio frisius]WPL22023.1 NAD-dependent protein deacylase [Thiorhodovibrio frisius]
MTETQTTPPMPFDDELLTRLRQSQHLVVFTGAGVSRESGIPTFRDALTGLWSQYEPEDLAMPDAFVRDPSLVWGWYEWRRALVARCEPNPAHLTIAALANRVPKLTLITQNVDGLHARAGSPDVLELHGSLERPRCFDCGTHCPPDAPMATDDQQRIEPPTCVQCGGFIRPGVVWFGEALPVDVWHRAKRAAQACDLMLSVGTSGLVYPAASLPKEAVFQQIPVVQINPEPTALDETMWHNLHGEAGVVLPSLLKSAWPDF